MGVPCACVTCLDVPLPRAPMCKRRELMLPYDERFRGWYGDKITQVRAMAAARRRFWVSADAWLVHRPHPPAPARALFRNEGGRSNVTVQGVAALEQVGVGVGVRGCRWVGGGALAGPGWFGRTRTPQLRRCGVVSLVAWTAGGGVSTREGRRRSGARHVCRCHDQACMDGVPHGVCVSQPPVPHAPAYTGPPGPPLRPSALADMCVCACACVYMCVCVCLRFAQVVRPRLLRRTKFQAYVTHSKNMDFWQRRGLVLGGWRPTLSAATQRCWQQLPWWRRHKHEGRH